MEQDLRTYVLDTSVLLSDPRAFFRFAEHNVVIPVVVITELEGKRHDPEIGYFARQALRHLDELRIEHGRLDFPVSVGEGGTLRVELTNTDAGVLPSGMRLGDNDTRILAVAHAPRPGRPGGHGRLEGPADAREGGVARHQRRGVPRRAGRRLGLDRHRHARRLGRRHQRPLRERGRDQRRRARAARSTPGLIIHSERGSALGRVTGDGSYRLVRGDREVFGLHGRSAEQRIAIDLLLDPEVGIVSLGGRAGTGKSALALCAGLEAVLERQQQKRIIVFRPLFAVGGQELGYLPGDAQEKMNPWGQAVFDTLGLGRLGERPRRGRRARAARGPAAHAHPRTLAARRVRDRR